MILSASDVLEDYSFLYRDVLDLTKLRRAELHSDPDEAFLAELGVAVRTVKPRTRQGGKNEANAKTSAHNSFPAAPQTAPAHTAEKKDKGSSEKASVSGAAPAKGDLSEQVLKHLTDSQRRIFELLPLDHAVTVDYLTREGFSVGEVMAAMTILEIKGLTVTLPGGLYSRK